MSRSQSVYAAAAVSLLWLISCRIAGAEHLLNIGDAPPTLAVSDWVKGTKVEKFEPGKTYVIEFWATWCGPCRASMPHTTALAHQYRDKDVQFIGVDVWEHDTTKVQPFVDEMGDKMDYNVALDTVPEGSDAWNGVMANTWLAAAEEDGIPTAFVISDRKIAWIGHPMKMDEPLAKIIDGKWDFAEMATQRLAEKALQRAQKALQAEMAEARRQIRVAFRAKEYKATLADIEVALNKFPEMAAEFEFEKLASLCHSGEVEAGLQMGVILLEKHRDDAGGLAYFWWVIDPERVEDVDPQVAQMALKAANRAAELTKEQDADVLHMLAEAQFRTGNADAAVATQEKAVRLLQAQNGPSADELKVHFDGLDRYRQAAANIGSE